MSRRLYSLGRAAGAAGVTLGIAAVGAAVGFAAERYVVGRSLRGPDPYVHEPFGTLRGAPVAVYTDDGVRLHVEVDEPDGGSGPTVIFTHGYALNLDSWHFQRRDLRGRARLVLWDQRSHGRSSRAPDDSVSFERLARDLAQVVEEVVPRGPVVLVGHSMGAMTVMQLAVQRPDLFDDRVAGVALVATSHRELATTFLGMPRPVGRLAHLAAPLVVSTLARRPHLIEHGRQAGSDLSYVLTKWYSFDGGGSPSLVRFVAEMIAATPIGVVAAFYPLFADNNQRDALPVLRRLPALVVAAEQDRLTPAEHSRELAEELPGAEYVEVADAGHMVQLEHHATVTEGIEKLLSRRVVRPDNSLAWDADVDHPDSV